MKKSLFIVTLALAMATVSCKKEDTNSEGAITNVSSDYKVMVVEWTATWCPPCGTYGYPNWDATHKKHEYKTTGISMHPADGVSSGTNAAQAALKGFWGFSGTPSGAVNLGTAFYPTSVETTVNAQIGQKAKAGIGISKTLSGSTLTIKTKTVFFDAVSGDVNLAVYVVENDIMNTQVSQTGVVPHNHVLRGSANGNFGESVASSPVKGIKVDGNYTFNVTSDTKNPANLHVVAVLWTMVAGKPSVYINSNMD